LSLLQDEEPDVRSRAANALGHLGQASSEVVSGLLSLLQDEEPDVRSRAANALGQLGQASSDMVVPILIEWLNQQTDAKGVKDVVNVLWRLVTGENG